MNKLNEKYGRITFGFLILSLISFPPMTIYMLYKIIRNTNIDTLDNYLSIKKCAKCFVWIPTIFALLGLLFGFNDFVTELDAYVTFGIYYGIYAIIFFIRAKNMKYYHEYVKNLNTQTASSYESPVEEEIYQEDVKADEYKVVICKSCGAKKQIVKGKKAKCEYCDSPLEA